MSRSAIQDGGRILVITHGSHFVEHTIEWPFARVNATRTTPTQPTAVTAIPWGSGAAPFGCVGRCCRARGTDRNWTLVDRKMSWSPAASSSQQRARVLTDVKARRFAPPRSAGLTALTPAPRTLVQTGSCRRCSLIHPLHVVVDVPSRMTLFRATADRRRCTRSRVHLVTRGSTHPRSTRVGRKCEALWRQRLRTMSGRDPWPRRDSTVSV